MKDKHHYESQIENRCECSEDSNCGCTYPENVNTFHIDDDVTRTEESFKIKIPERFIQKDTVCYCNPKNCDCTITYDEKDAE